MKAIRLRTEYLFEPLGLGIAAPRLFWNVQGGTRQTAYRIVARRDGTAVWDTGKVVSSRMTHIRYEGAALRSRDRVEWSVVLWDENGAEGEPATSRFELGSSTRPTGRLGGSPATTSRSGTCGIRSTTSAASSGCGGRCGAPACT